MKMKNYFLILLLVFGTVSGFGQDMFRDGAVWSVVQYSSECDPPKETMCVEYIDGVEDIDGVEAFCLKMRQANESAECGKLLTYVRCEGEKVWFIPDLEKKEWRLLYDFGMQPGDKCEVAFGKGGGAYTIKCVGLTKDSNNPGVIRMEVENWYEDYPETPFYRRGYWLKGIGCEYGFIHNVPEFILIGTGSKLVDASIDDSVIYRASEISSPAGLADSFSEKNCLNDTRIFDLQGRELTEPVSGQPYIQQGKLKVVAN